MEGGEPGGSRRTSIQDDDLDELAIKVAFLPYGEEVEESDSDSFLTGNVCDKGNLLIMSGDREEALCESCVFRPCPGMATSAEEGTRLELWRTCSQRQHQHMQSDGGNTGNRTT